jgi:hypothetical protein
LAFFFYHYNCFSLKSDGVFIIFHALTQPF